MSRAPLFDPRDVQAQLQPYALYARLREEDPVHRSPFGMWVLSRDADVRAALRDPRFSSRPSRFSVHARQELQDLPASRMVRDMVMFQDAPEHTRLRRLLARVITDNLASNLRERILHCVDELLAPHAARGEMDLLHDFAIPLPVQVISELLGIPPQDRHLLKRWAGSVFQVFSPITDASAYRELNGAVQEFRDYLGPLVQLRRREPQRDVISQLIQLRDEADALSDDELITSCILLFANGEESFAHALCNGLHALLNDAGQLQQLRADPSLVRPAFEEFIRYDSPAQVVGRTLLEPIELHGRVIPKGVPVYLLLGSANRDPARWAEPDRFDIRRADADHLGFGHGRHSCLGAGIARVEAQVALTRLLERLQGLALAEADPPWRADFFLRGLQRLPVRFRPF
ncbi:MAG: cytochrome P450 [Inhella sp.]